MKTREDLTEEEIMMLVAGYADKIKTGHGMSVNEVSDAIERMEYFNEKRRVLVALSS